MSSDVVRYEAAMLSFLRSDKPEILAKIRDTKALDDDTAAALKDALTDFGKQFALRWPWQPQGPQAPHRLGQVDAEDHQGDEDGRGGEAAPCPAARPRPARPYSARMTDVVGLAGLAGHAGPAEPEAARPAPARTTRHLIIVATSDRGLAGAFNSNIVRAARRKADELIAQGKTVLFYIVGRKGRPVLQRLYPQARSSPSTTPAR